MVYCGLQYAYYRYREECIHIGVGFDVARSTIQGNAKASISGTSDKKVPTLLFCSKLQLLIFRKPMMGTLRFREKTMENKTECLKNVGNPKTYAFELPDQSIQVCLHRGQEWEDCYLLVKLGDEIREINCNSVNCKTDSALKVLFCTLFTSADDGKICFEGRRIQELDSQLRDYLKEKKGVSL